MLSNKTVFGIMTALSLTAMPLSALAGEPKLSGGFRVGGTDAGEALGFELKASDFPVELELDAQTAGGKERAGIRLGGPTLELDVPEGLHGDTLELVPVGLTYQGTREYSTSENPDRTYSSADLELSKTRLEKKERIGSFELKSEVAVTPAVEVAIVNGKETFDPALHLTLRPQLACLLGDSSRVFAALGAEADFLPVNVMSYKLSGELGFQTEVEGGTIFQFSGLAKKETLDLEPRRSKPGTEFDDDFYGVAIGLKSKSAL